MKSLSLYAFFTSSFAEDKREYEIIFLKTISADMVLYEVLSTGYDIKVSLLNEKLESLSAKDKTLVYNVVDAIIAHKIPPK